ncbi:MAG: N-acetylmuramoyl-L-alanine amidase [Oscillospiraceae bacterium]|nr:N-acetylmuramoyl-L-alanine amidase [Oscillospiraceae bacterium]
MTVRERQASVRARRKKRGKRLMIAYALRVVVFLLPALMIVLIICGALYIMEHLAPAPDSELPDWNIGNSTGNPTVAGSSIIPAAPSIPGQVKIVLDAGHGGDQPGCVINGTAEKDITLSIVLLLQEKLESEGAAVVLTRSTDYDVSLPDRSEIANKAGANYFISIHCNSYEDDSSVKGFECYYYQSAKSENLAEAITSEADSHSISTREVKEENYAVLRETAIPAVLIEVGFLTNTEERGKLMSQEYQELLAEAIASGILGYNDAF